MLSFRFLACACVVRVMPCVLLACPGGHEVRTFKQDQDVVGPIGPSVGPSFLRPARWPLFSHFLSWPRRTRSRRYRRRGSRVGWSHDHLTPLGNLTGLRLDSP